jgi:hypothetical protein
VGLTQHGDAPPEVPDAALVLQDTNAWLERAVIGLNLCPFAKAVHVKGQVHLCGQRWRAALPELLAELRRELADLQATRTPRCGTPRCWWCLADAAGLPGLQ